MCLEKLNHIRSILEKYKGTHSYHNFTSGKRMGEMSAQRYIIDFDFEPPFLQEDMEFMTFMLKVSGKNYKGFGCTVWLHTETAQIAEW